MRCSPLRSGGCRIAGRWGALHNGDVGQGITTRMDPICHTLVGLCLADSGLKRRTALGTATLVIAANLPDLDVLAIPLRQNLAWRRGWTHGILALVVWPLLLTGWMRWWSAARQRRDLAEPRADPRWLLLLSALGVLTH